MRASIINILNQAKTDIQSNMQRYGINASGRTSSSFVVEDYREGIRLISRGDGVPPIPTLEVGRRAGNVPKGFRSIIEQWSRDKGINFGKESERKTFAYFVAKKIADKGTDRHATPNNDVYTPIVESVKDKISKIYIAKITQTIKTHI